jgi:hypothetical protein
MDREEKELSKKIKKMENSYIHQKIKLKKNKFGKKAN